jgi:hypothetical protein
MAYPIVPATYGFKPVNLIGGQVFSGSTRQLPIQYGFNTNIFYGDVVGIARGFITRETVTTGAGATTGSLGTVGIFLGCNYTDPVTKQKRYSQYWPAGTLAGDAFAVVTDDPDTLFQVAVTSTTGTTAIGSVATSMIGLNVAGSDLAGSINTGDSSNAIVGSTAANTSTLPFRIVDLKRDSAVSVTATYSSGTGTPTLTVSALPSNLLVGTEVGYIAANGQYVGSGSWVSTFAAAGTTTVVLNAAPATVASPAGTTTVTQTIPASSTLVFTQYPEAYVKFNFGIHEYYNATANAATL